MLPVVSVLCAYCACVFKTSLSRRICPACDCSSFRESRDEDLNNWINEVEVMCPCRQVFRSSRAQEKFCGDCVLLRRVAYASMRGHATPAELFWAREDLAKTKLDLQREGIEPNPGPRGRSRSKGSVRSGSRSRSALRQINRSVTRADQQRSRSRKRSVSVAVPNRPAVSSNSLVGFARNFSREHPQLADLAGKVAVAADAAYPYIKSAVGYIMGSGDYTVGLPPASNTLMNPKQDPVITQRDRGAMFSRREFLGDLYASATPNAFQVQSFPINPGLSSTFPWLAGIAPNFRKYRFSGVVLEYRPMANFASTQISSGSVFAAFACDPNAQVPTNKAILEQMGGACSTAPYHGCLVGMECAVDQNIVNWHLVRTTAPSTSTVNDLRFYDSAVLFVGTVGVPTASANLGELWLNYNVEFADEVMDPGLSVQFSQYYANSPSSVAAGTLMGTNALMTAMFGKPDFLRPTFVNTGNSVVVTSSYGVIGALYRVRAYWTWAAAGAVLAPFTWLAIGGCTTTGPTAYYAPTASVAGGSASAMTEVNVRCTATTFAFSLDGTGSAMPASCTFAGIDISQMNSNAV
jgi:hypothetical protein